MKQLISLVVLLTFLVACESHQGEPIAHGEDVVKESRGTR